MPDVLTVGLSESLAGWLETRVPGVVVTRAAQADDVLDRLTHQQWALLIVDDPSAAAPDVLREARRRPPLARLPVIYALEPALGSELPGRLIEQYGVSQILFHPLDREELAHQVALALGVTLPPTHPEQSPARGQISSAVAALWDRFRDANLDRVAVLDAAAQALEAGQLDLDTRRHAEREAHKLAGSVGTFGFTRGSELAREIERFLRPGASQAPSDARRMSEGVAELRAELSAGPPTGGAARPTPRSAKAGPLVLIVDDDPEVSQQLALAAASQGLRAEIAPSLAQAREAIAGQLPDAVLLDLVFPNSAEDGLTLLATLAEQAPSVPVMVLTARDEFTDRVDVARLGGRGFLRKSMPAEHVVEAVSQMINRLRSDDSKILAVDDDPQVLAALRALLEPRGLKVTTIDDPLLFWEALKETSPDLVVLDVDMPRLSGIELCRVVRNEARWASIPVLFLTARNDPDSVYRIFTAGADDYVAKPIVGPELITRITNRLERVRLYRRMAETDFLTGVANSRKATQVLDQLMTLAKRHDQPMCLCIVDLDRFKLINDRHGHTLGDAVLRRIGELFVRRFRGTDLVSRWGGEEFILAMYGMTCQDGVQRVAEALEIARNLTFEDADGAAFTVTFSAGVAQFPRDGAEFVSLYRAADEALYLAKGAGRDRVLPSGWRPAKDREPNQVDALVLMADGPLAEVVVRALETRGYRARWIKDGGEASRALAGPNPSLTPAVVLLADDLPGSDGLDLAPHPDSTGAATHPRTILLALGSDQGRVARALEAGSVDVVTAPFDLPALMSKVRRAIEAA
ncbi:MAG: response regulator [Chloroflexota bacterium]